MQSPEESCRAMRVCAADALMRAAPSCRPSAVLYLRVLERNSSDFLPDDFGYATLQVRRKGSVMNEDRVPSNIL